MYCNFVPLLDLLSFEGFNLILENYRGGGSYIHKFFQNNLFLLKTRA